MLIVYTHTYINKTSVWCNFQEVEFLSKKFCAFVILAVIAKFTFIRIYTVLHSTCKCVTIAVPPLVLSSGSIINILGFDNLKKWRKLLEWI